MDVEINERSSLLIDPESTCNITSIFNKTFDICTTIWYKLESYHFGIYVTILVISTTSERFIFKMVVDEMFAYRVILVEAIFIISAMTFGLITFLKQGFSASHISSTKHFPQTQIMFMAALDTVQFSGLLISAYALVPTMTVVLLNMNTPCILIFSKCIFPERVYNFTQMKGSIVIGVGVILSVIKSALWNNINDYSSGSFYSTFFFVLFASAQGISTLYKEKLLIEFAHPIDLYQLSFWLFSYQSIFMIFLSPFMYLFQGVSNKRWEGYPMNQFFNDMYDGILCLFLQYSHENDNMNDDDDNLIDRNNQCSNWLLVYVLFYVLSTILVLECINKIVQTNTSILNRIMSISVFTSFIALGIYDGSKNQGNNVFHTHIGYIDIISLTVLLTGMELYGNEKEPDIEYITSSK